MYIFPKIRNIYRVINKVFKKIASWLKNPEKPKDILEDTSLDFAYFPF